MTKLALGHTVEFDSGVFARLLQLGPGPRCDGNIFFVVYKNGMSVATIDCEGEIEYTLPNPGCPIDE
jgi:hypothetical protein